MIERPLIDLRAPLHISIDESEEAIASDPTVFQRSGELVQITSDQSGWAIKPLRTSMVRYLLSRVAYWVSEEEQLIHPPTFIARALLERATYNSVRRLRTVATFPPLSSNGELMMEEGYHEDTEVYFTGGIECQVPSKPTIDQARKAIKTILDVVVDFPFVSFEHRTAWLAALLSPLSRFAHQGNIPLVVIQANSPRVGKTRLAHLISLIVSGMEVPVVVHTKNEDEERKRIVGYLRSGRSVVLIDNITGRFGGQTVNALLTSRRFEDRVLGQSKILNLPNDATWFITGNNITLAPDTSERCLHIRLCTDVEHPHLRSDFKYPNLFQTVLERRVELLSAALTILKAFILAGSPNQSLPGWGSFEEWSSLVRSALVWCGLPDVASTRTELETTSDVGKQLHRRLVEGWFALMESTDYQEGMTCREAYTLMSSGAISPVLRDALEEIAGGVDRIPPPHTIGRYLREIKDRVFGDKVLRCIPDEKRGHTWKVEASVRTSTLNEASKQPVPLIYTDA